MILLWATNYLLQSVSVFRWHSFLLYFGYSVAEIPDQKPNEVFKMVSHIVLSHRCFSGLTSSGRQLPS